MRNEKAWTNLIISWSEESIVKSCHRPLNIVRGLVRRALLMLGLHLDRNLCAVKDRHSELGGAKAFYPKTTVPKHLIRCNVLQIFLDRPPRAFCVRKMFPMHRQR